MKFKKTIATSLAAALLATGAMAGPTQANTKTFRDVSDTAWYYKSVQKLVQHNIISGYADETFKPGQNITRGQAATILARALELNLSDVKNPGFKDVPKNHSNYAAIAALTEIGVFKKNERFNPSSFLTRAQMAQILVEAFELNTDKLKSFTDVKSTDWSHKYIGTLGQLGITTNEGKFNPQGYISRAHIAAFIERIIDQKRTDYKYDLWDEWSNWAIVEDFFEAYEEPNTNQSTDDPDDLFDDDDDFDDYFDEYDEEEEDFWDFDFDEYEPDKEYEEPVTKPTTQLTEPELASYVFDLDKNTKDLESALIRLKADLKDYKEIERDKEATKKEVEEVFEDVDDAQRNMKKLVERANLLLKDVAKIVNNSSSMASSQKQLERMILDATAELNASYDTVVDIESIQDDLEDALDDVVDEIERAEKTLAKENVDVEDLEDTYDDLSAEVKIAKKILEIADNSKVAVVRGLREDLRETIKDAEDLLSDLLDKVGDLETDYEYETDRIMSDFGSLTKKYNGAISAKDAADIAYYKKKILEKIDEAEDLVDDMQYTKLNKLTGYIKELEAEIEDIERFLDKADKRID